jgi:hypothetical protein
MRILSRHVEVKRRQETASLPHKLEVTRKNRMKENISLVKIHSIEICFLCEKIFDDLTTVRETRRTQIVLPLILFSLVAMRRQPRGGVLFDQFEIEYRLGTSSRG